LVELVPFAEVARNSSFENEPVGRATFVRRLGSRCWCGRSDGKVTPFRSGCPHIGFAQGIAIAIESAGEGRTIDDDAGQIVVTGEIAA